MGKCAWAVFLVVLAAGCASAEPESLRTPGPADSDKVRRETHLVAGHDRPELPCLKASASDRRPKLEMGDTFFAPACVVLRDRSDLRLGNRGALVHSFGVRSVGVEVNVVPGASERVSLEELRGLGPTQLFCRFHAAAGMTGTITVL